VEGGNFSISLVKAGSIKTKPATCVVVPVSAFSGVVSRNGGIAKR